MNTKGFSLFVKFKINFLKSGEKMYLHLGQGTVIKTSYLIGLFDLDNSTVSKKTRDFLTLAEKRGQVVNVTDDLPKTFAVTAPKNSKKQTVYISQISTVTLEKRSKKGFTYFE